jgi:DNA-binding transcriptional LysR family regulator
MSAMRTAIEPEATATPAILGHRIEQLRMRDMQLLEHLAQTGSLRATAERLHVTQPAVSQALQGLEQAFGVTLVQRGRRGQRGLGLTAAGQAALARLRVARQELLAAQAAAQAPHTTWLRIGAPPLAMLHVLPPALARLKAAWPQIQVELREASVAGLWDLLDTGEVDALVCRLPDGSGGRVLPPGTVWQQLSVGTEALALVAGEAHRLAPPRRSTLAQLAQQDWALPPVGTATRQAFDQLFMRASLSPPRAGIQSSLFHSNLLLAANGHWLTVAPLAAVKLYAQALHLKVLPAPWPVDPIGVGLALRDSSLGHPAVQALRRAFEPGVEPAAEPTSMGPGR